VKIANDMSPIKKPLHEKTIETFPVQKL